MTTPPLFPGLDGLMTLSRREGVDIRPTLLRVLTDLYVQASKHSADEERQFVELTSRLIDQVDDATRAAVRARLAIYPSAPAETLRKLGLGPVNPARRIPLAREIPSPPVAPAQPSPLSEAQLRLQANLSMQPKDAAEIHDMFFRASASERALILHNLAETPLRASARIPAARALRAVETLEMAAFATDVESFTIEVGETSDIAGARGRPGRQRSRRRTARMRCAGARYAERGFSAGAVVPESRNRHFGAPRLSAVAALRSLERALGAGHAGGLARLDHGGDPRQISPRSARRRTPARAHHAGASPPHRATRLYARCAHRHAGIGTIPLPVEPFRYYQYGERVVHLDGCVEVEAAYYGLPPGWIGRGVKVQWDELYVRILDPKCGLLLREHVRQKRGWYRTRPEDQPQQTPFRVVQLLGRAGRVGTHVGTLCNLIYSQQGEVGVRRVLGVLALAKKHGTAAVDEACAAALEMSVHEYRFVRRYLERCPQAPLSLRQVDPLIRELVHYRDLIQTKTKEPSE